MQQWAQLRVASVWCGNSLVLNREDCGVTLCLCLRMMVQNKIACYTINIDASDGCHVCFTTREYAAGENGHLLDGAVVKITEVFTPDHENHTMQCLYHHNCGYTYAIVVCSN